MTSPSPLSMNPVRLVIWVQLFIILMVRLPYRWIINMPINSYQILLTFRRLTYGNGKKPLAFRPSKVVKICSDGYYEQVYGMV